MAGRVYAINDPFGVMILRKISTHAERSVTQDDLQPTNEDLVVDVLRQEFVESSHVQHIVDGLLN